MTILTASLSNRKAIEVPGAGAGLLVHALSSAAANLLAEVTVGSAYAYVDLSPGARSLPPMFKIHVREFVLPAHGKATDPQRRPPPVGQSIPQPRRSLCAGPGR